MKINIDFYHKFKPDIKNADIEIPSDAIFVRMPWTKFGRKLRSCPNATDCEDMMAHDYYIFVPDILSGDAISIQLERCKDISTYGDMVYFRNGLLIRLYSCDITTPVNYVTLDELNEQIDFSDQYYAYIYEMPLTHEQNQEFRDICLTKKNDDFVVAFKSLHERTLKTRTMFKIVRLREEGAYVKDVGITKDYSDMPDDTIEHFDLPIESLVKNQDKSDGRYVEFKGIDYKEIFEKRINEIVNI